MFAGGDKPPPSAFCPLMRLEQNFLKANTVIPSFWGPRTNLQFQKKAASWDHATQCRLGRRQIAHV